MFARMRLSTVLWLWLSLTVRVVGATVADTHSLLLQGIPLQGQADSLAVALQAAGFAPWGEAEDGSVMHFRGNFYGIRCKLMVSVDEETGLVSSAYVTNGPYATRELYDRNMRYFLLKLQQDYGEFSVRNAAYYKVTDYGVIKLSDEITETGSREIKMFFMPTTPFYKDAITMGLRGHVMEVSTENPVAENPIEHFDKQGRLVQTDMTDRHYDAAGYLTTATMKEADGGLSQLKYEYDTKYRLVRRTLTNTAANIRYVNEYSYDDEDDVTTQSQKVFDATGECVLSLLLKNQFEDFDDKGNWTHNILKVTYWEKDTGTQQIQTEQRRIISYWEE